MRAMKDQIQYCFKFSSIQRKREPYIFYLFQGTHIEVESTNQEALVDIRAKIRVPHLRA
ncbi:protein of unknown function [Methanoculleus bourgensis]|uniref:Uncharacterized protein n=1 Tax=Methanoculleus bourgensis TaxID=83986 RepID=A0A0X3BMI3_9EURY|nr:protein of unknown function [Methanoculleus bourgensis]